MRAHEEKDGELLVVAMTRPVMLGGFTLMSVALSIYVPVMLALILRCIWACLLVPALLLASYLVCLKDVYLFDIAAAAMRLCACPNKRILGCRRYAPW